MISLRNTPRLLAKTFRQPAYALRVLRQRLPAYWYHRFGRGKSSLPEAVTLFLTHKCNLRCKMCGQWGERGVTRKNPSQEMLTLAELKGLVDELAGFKPNITLFGGEPLLHPDCLELIRYIKAKGMHALIITNGALIGDFAEELVLSGLDELNVSLDGREDLHDEIRGQKGVFDRIKKGLKQIQHYKMVQGRTRPLISLQCTINQYNYRRLDEMLEVANEAGADSLTFHHLIFSTKEILEKQREFDSRLNCGSADWEGFVFDPGIDPETLYKQIKKIRSGKRRLALDFYPNFSFSALKEYYQNPSYEPKEDGARCLSPWIASYVFPDGEVRPCLNFDYSFGNIKQNSFSQIWNSGAAIKFRSEVKGHDLFPACVRCTELYRY